MKKIQYNGISKLLSGIVSKINNLIDIVEMKADWEQTDPTAFDYIKNKPDSLDEKVKQENTTTDADYRVLLSKSANDITEIDKTWKNSDLKYNPFTGNLTAVRLNGNEIGNDPQFTDTTYENKAAVQGGSAESLVTTGEKYNWNTAHAHSHLTSGNPHNVTKSDVGLGNVPNVSTDNQTPTVTEATQRDNIANGDNLKTIIGKIKKFFADLKTVAFTGSYNDLTDKPIIPSGQVQSDWEQDDDSEVDYIKHKPTLADVATSGDYSDLLNTPTIPTVNNAKLTINQNGTLAGEFTANASSPETINLTDTTYTASGVVSIDENNNITSTAEVNQNTFAKVKVGSTTITADAKQDTLELYAGNNITLTPDATNDKVTINATDTTYTAGTRIAISSSNVISTTAEINQNAFSNVKVGDVTIEADSKTDILELIQGSNVTLTPNATNDSITIAATDTNTHRPIQLNGTQILGNNTTALNLKNGNNISMTNSSGTVTINATGIPTALSDLSTDTTHRVVTDTQISSWDAKAGSDTKVTQTNNTANTYLPILLANSTTSPETTTVKKNTNLTANPSNGYMDVNSLRIHSNVADHDSNFARLYCANTGDRRYKLPVDKANDSELAVVADIPTQASDIGALPSTTKYAGSSTVGGVATSAVTAEKLSNTSKVGDTNRPVYFTAGGVPAQISYTIDKSVPSNAVFTDTKVTTSGNHYAPSTVSGEDESASASGATAAWGIDVVKGVTLNTDGKGHVTGISVTSGKIPSNPVSALDVAQTSVDANKTIATWKETDGKVAITTQDISITKSQVSDFPSTMPPSSHTHGNIQNDGKLQTTDVTIASGDKIVVTDSSDSDKLARTSISFNGSTTTKALSQKGTWESYLRLGSGGSVTADTTFTKNLYLTSKSGDGVLAVRKWNGDDTTIDITSDTNGVTTTTRYNTLVRGIDINTKRMCEVQSTALQNGNTGIVLSVSNYYQNVDQTAPTVNHADVFNAQFSKTGTLTIYIGSNTKSTTASSVAPTYSIRGNANFRTALGFKGNPTWSKYASYTGTGNKAMMVANDYNELFFCVHIDEENVIDMTIPMPIPAITATSSSTPQQIRQGYNYATTAFGFVSINVWIASSKVYCKLNQVFQNNTTNKASTTNYDVYYR